MLGIPSGPGLAGVLLLVAGLLLVAFATWRRRAALPADVMGRVAAACMLLTLAFAPYLAWRIVEDIRVTTAMGPYDLEVAGPVQTYLQPYLLDPVREIIPPGATFATVAGSGVPYAAARGALAPLAMWTLFPRRSVADPRQAEWVIAWGTSLRGIAPVDRVTVARPAQGGYPAVVVARVRR